MRASFALASLGVVAAGVPSALRGVSSAVSTQGGCSGTSYDFFMLVTQWDITGVFYALGVFGSFHDTTEFAFSLAPRIGTYSALPGISDEVGEHLHQFLLTVTLQNAWMSSTAKRPTTGSPCTVCKDGISLMPLAFEGQFWRFVAVSTLFIVPPCTPCRTVAQRQQRRLPVRLHIRGF